MTTQDRWIHTPPRKSATFDDYSIAEIRRAAATGIYDIRGGGFCFSVRQLADIRSKVTAKNARQKSQSARASHGNQSH